MRVEEPVLVGTVVAGLEVLALLAGTDVPLLGGDDRRLERAQSGESEAEHARGQDVRTVDHQREVAAAATRGSPG